MYKVRVIGADASGEAEFVFFATVAKQIIGKRLDVVMRNASNRYLPLFLRNSHSTSVLMKRDFSMDRYLSRLTVYRKCT
jgi:hypothetical protein